MAPRAYNMKVACIALLCCAALVESRAARRKRQIDSNLVGQNGGSSTNLCQPLPAPGHGTIACGAGFPFYSCTASCDAGYQFPSGMSSDKRECDQMFGEWFDPPGKDIADCVPVCKPDCQNGGKCILPNTCTCTGGFMGKQCQYPASNCAAPPQPQNGKLTCQQDTSGARCSVTCNQGFKPAWTISPSYDCSPDGTWSPPKSEIPRCVSESTVINNTHVATSTNHPSTGSARCVAWGQDHYRTFDNKVYHYKGSCSYVLVKDAVSNRFHIHVQNDKNCQAGHRCKREMEIYMGNEVITLKRDASGPSIKWNGAEISIPSNKGGVIFEKVSHYIIIRSNIGFQVRWDGYEMIFVTVTDELRGKTQGLCGIYDGDQTNDFTTDSGSVVTEPASFVSTWKRSLAGETCADQPQTGCSSADAQVVSASNSACQALMGSEFALCHHAVDPARYVAACKEDCCASGGTDCVCSSMEAYASECLNINIKLDWRSDKRCPVQCPGNQIHKECGSMCQKTCQSPAAACEDHSCIDGCFCPDGMVLLNDMCVQQSQCPCVLNGKEYKSGDVVPKECNKCTCMNGGWQCTKKRCEATCSAIGDPHYMTFDGKRYDFMGQCSYYLIYDPSFDVIADNIKCGHGSASCTKSITIHFNGHQIKMDHNHQLFIDGNEITSLPYDNNGIKIFMVSSLFMKAELANGISILWDGRTRAYITAPPSFINKTKGLCGTYDFNQKNDFKTMQGDIETNINAFGNRWKTVPTCQNVPLNASGNPCDENINRKNQSAQYCNYLKSDIFKACRDLVDPDDFYKSCMYDMCACTENLRECLCPMLGEYASQCSAAGVDIRWRLEIDECHIPCTGGQEYQVCPNECTRTCNNLANDPNCIQSSVCAEGCGCPVNQTLDDNGNCITIDSCPCKFSGQEFKAGAVVERGDQICTCLNGRFTCAAKPVGSKISGLSKICKANEEYSQCVSGCPMTCLNMHDPTAMTCNTTVCNDGCVCKPGYVREGNECLLKDDCPCYHGGLAYKEGEKFTMDCNECTCRSRLWVCEDKDCPAVCSAYGDSHYTTFDGKGYEFQGSCDYVFAKSTDSNPIKFEITTENIPCGTTGVTCTRSISFSIGEQGTANFYRIQLVKGKPVVPEAGSPFEVREVGNFIIITTPQGITLEWDKGTRLYLKLRTEHKGQVQGLCGNFDGDQKNDFSTPQGGPSASRSTTFADSWKVHGFCANSKVITDTCEANTERRPWAQQRCNIISSKVFQKCHSVVPYQEYLDKCIFDACACDTGGDCECLCTAVAAYAHQCAMNGVPISWRTEELCPIMCENCETYNPCISICPKKTCDNRLVYDTLTTNCGQEVCVEGCDIKPCPAGQVYESDKEPFKCIPEAFCNTTCLTINGKEYKEGERILDETVCRMDCEVCFCDNNAIQRSGVCTGTPPPVHLPSVSPMMMTGSPTIPPSTLTPLCVRTGPTAWMSVGTPTPYNQGDIESIAALRQQYTFCEASQMTAIECRVVGTQTSSAASKQRVFCDLRNGLKCYHSDQKNGEQCLNYEVRITCECGK